MYERFTENARKVMRLARREANQFGHDYLGTEHMLLALLEVNSGIAAQALSTLGVQPQDVRRELENLVQIGLPNPPAFQPPKTPRVKRALDEATSQAKRSVSFPQVSTGHLLLGLLSQSDGVAAEILTNLGVSPEGVRRAVSDELFSPLMGDPVPLQDNPLQQNLPEHNQPEQPGDLLIWKAVEMDLHAQQVSDSEPQFAFYSDDRPTEAPTQTLSKGPQPAEQVSEQAIPQLDTFPYLDSWAHAQVTTEELPGGGASHQEHLDSANTCSNTTRSGVAPSSATSPSASDTSPSGTSPSGTSLESSQPGDRLVSHSQGSHPEADYSRKIPTGRLGSARRSRPWRWVLGVVVGLAVLAGLRAISEPSWQPTQRERQLTQRLVGQWETTEGLRLTLTPGGNVLIEASEFAGATRYAVGCDQLLVANRAVWRDSLELHARDQVLRFRLSFADQVHGQQDEFRLTQLDPIPEEFFGKPFTLGNPQFFRQSTLPVLADAQRMPEQYLEPDLEQLGASLAHLRILLKTLSSQAVSLDRDHQELAQTLEGLRYDALAASPMSEQVASQPVAQVEHPQAFLSWAQPQHLLVEFQELITQIRVTEEQIAHTRRQIAETESFLRRSRRAILQALADPQGVDLAALEHLCADQKKLFAQEDPPATDVIPAQGIADPTSMGDPELDAILAEPMRND